MKPSQQQRGIGLSSDKRGRPKLGAGASFGNAGIEPSKNKARLASSQMHVFREAPTQEQVSKPEMAKAPQLKLNAKPVPKAFPLRQNMKLVMGLEQGATLTSSLFGRGQSAPEATSQS